MIAPFVKAAAEDAKVLEALLGDDWEVKAGGCAEIVLTAKFDVLRESYFWREGVALPEFSDAISRKELIQRNARAMKYEIRLSYCEPMTREEYEARLAERQGAALTRAFGAGEKKAPDGSAEILAKTSLPRYKSRDCHVFEETSDTLTGHIFPPAAVKKIGAAKAILAETLNSMPSGTDATAAGVK